MKQTFKISLFLLIALGLAFFIGSLQTVPANIPWHISRAAAIVAYLLMFLVIFLGTGLTTGFIYGSIDPLKAWGLHRNLSISMTVALLIHIISITFDKFINFSLGDILIPFASKFKPLYLSLGIFGFYLLLLIMLSSIFLRLKSPKLWLTIHFLTYLLFIFSFVHGVFMGTDTKTVVMQGVYWGTALIFIALIGYRFLIYPYRAKA